MKIENDNRICYFCKKEVASESSKVSINGTCHWCGNDLHCCLNCKYFDESKPNKCSEPESEWISNRERRNYCSFFEYRLESYEGFPGEKLKEELKKKADSLFKK
ncbi:MAG: hypothetical protein HZA77_15795 [Candidatus Schekmanbacteria bacterium]|nr:hypothetical protein [Candidatus Schekmanbacteria bacterium]